MTFSAPSPYASVAYSYSDAGDLLTLNHTISDTGSVPHYTLTYTAAHQLWTEACSDPIYVWQPAAASTDTHTTADKAALAQGHSSVGAVCSARRRHET